MFDQISGTSILTYLVNACYLVELEKSAGCKSTLGTDSFRNLISCQKQLVELLLECRVQ